MKSQDIEDGFWGTSPATVNVAGGQDAYTNTMSALSVFDLSAAEEKRVLLKPNAGRIAKPGSGITTDPQVVAAAIDAFKEAGAIVTVGESPITGVRTMYALEATGIAGVARDRDCPVVDLDERDPVAVDIPEGRAINTLLVCADVLEHDLVVSIPVMKMHMHTGVTLAVKNMKGCLWRRSKVELHMLPETEDGEKSLDVAIADMASVLRPHFSILDGTVGMEGLGPSAGEPRQLGVVIAGPDAFAVDSTGCRLMGLSPRDIPHLRMGADRGLGLIEVKQLDITPPEWQQWAQPFTPAPTNLSIEFPDVTILDRNSCSGCQSTVLLFLQKHSKELFDYFGKELPVRIAIGKGHEDIAPNTLCIGNCTAKHKNSGIFVTGCPPVSSAILKAISKNRCEK